MSKMYPTIPKEFMFFKWITFRESCLGVSCLVFAQLDLLHAA